MIHSWHIKLLFDDAGADFEHWRVADRILCVLQQLESLGFIVRGAGGAGWCYRVYHTSAGALTFYTMKFGVDFEVIE